MFSLSKGKLFRLYDECKKLTMKVMWYGLSDWIFDKKISYNYLEHYSPLLVELLNVKLDTSCIKLNYSLVTLLG